ncbi:MAG: hypothetical protein DRI86_14595 [Bacteroidetes bacterium]|nr:MAG: hypothetical protein DRI86_14595 [Bacteroidota bacterium]
MLRDIHEELKEWKNDYARKPLLLEGSRQVGKTYSVIQFAKEEYKNHIHINFERNKKAHLIFEPDLDPKRIIVELSALTGVKIEPRNTLIFFDEIQALQIAITSLKYFYEEVCEYHVIAAGSLLGINFGNTSNFPVGKVNFLKMFPMTFFEYLKANNEDNILDIISKRRPIAPISPAIHERLNYIFREYLFVGGMPEAVFSFIKDKNFKKVRKIQLDVLDAYRRDFAKYASPSRASKIIEFWDSIPYQLARENKKFKFREIKKGARKLQYDTILVWLKSAGLVNVTYNVSTAKLPLAGYNDGSKFKVYLVDSGLLGAMIKLSPAIIIEPDGIFKEYNGAFIENYVASTLKSQGFYDLFYWTSRGEAEVDYLIQYNDKIYPIEVKSGTNRNIKSLRSYEQKFHPEFLIRTSPRNYVQSNEFINIPLYSFSAIHNIMAEILGLEGEALEMALFEATNSYGH